MGGRNSKTQSSGQEENWGKHFKGGQRWRYRYLGEESEKFLPYQPESDKELNCSLTEETFIGNPRREIKCTQRQQQDFDQQEEVGFPVKPRVPIRDPTYKLMIDYSHFLKEKGGLEDIFYSARRHAILELHAQNEWGIIPGWLQYTEGPGIRYPKYFGFLFKLVPVEIADPDYENDERNILLHDAHQGQMEDPYKERLVWKFDSQLAYCYKAGHEAHTKETHTRRCMFPKRK
ncbi:nef protein [Simian immunodeficiency virus]|uniref:Protein Nef n=1 Tax=Simian immunodeficiency virus TaxID=11723 RepID=D5G2S2_SIV|nr:nef protein [Simian immunodeficiency virus]